MGNSTWTTHWEQGSAKWPHQACWYQCGSLIALNFPEMVQVMHSRSGCTYSEPKLLPGSSNGNWHLPKREWEKLSGLILPCLVLESYQGWTMLRKDVYPFRHFLLKRFVLHQQKTPYSCGELPLCCGKCTWQRVPKPGSESSHCAKVFAWLQKCWEREFLFRKLENVGSEFALCLIQSLLKSVQCYHGFWVRVRACRLVFEQENNW